MTTLKVGIASYEDMKARTLAVARGERRVSPAEPKVWFISTESPYFLQEWGYQAWNAAALSPIDKVTVGRATAAAIKKLDESFFRVRFDRLAKRTKCGP
jgi:hypothetical protein